jgi:hypothetical protein
MALGGAWWSGVVDGSPWEGPGEVGDELWWAELLFLDGRWTAPEVLQVSDKAAGKDHEDATVNEFGHFFVNEVGVLGGRLVAPLADGGVLLFQGPWVGGGVHGHSVVVPLTEQSSGWMVNVIEVFGEARFTLEGGDEVHPGGGGHKLRHEFGH